jgi:hypothetical protein
VSEWRPIETAPKDETTVLLHCPQSWDTEGLRVGWWHDGHWYDDESASHPLTDLYGEPTHWMPAPPPPKTSDKEGDARGSA